MAPVHASRDFVAGFRDGWAEPSEDPMGSRPVSRAAIGALADIVLSLLLGALLVHDAELLPADGGAWVAAGLLLLPGVLQRIWFELRWSGADLGTDADAVATRKIAIKVAALLAVIAAEAFAHKAGIPPSIAVGAIAPRVLVLLSLLDSEKDWHQIVAFFTSGIVCGYVLMGGLSDRRDSTVFSGSAPSLGESFRDVVSLAAIIVLFELVRRGANAQEKMAAAVAGERARIARELHDVVAHQMTGVVLQAQGAAAVLTTDPDRAATALATIERSSRAALDELRRLLGVFREGEVAVGAVPLDESHGETLPTLRQVPAMFEKMDLGSCDARLHVPDDLPAGVEASAYRIIQEAVTNARRHAGRVAMVIRADAADGVLTVEVRNEAPDEETTDLQGAGAGHGVRGMRERAEALGGTFRAGRTDDGGWAVHATLPFVSVDRPS